MVPLFGSTVGFYELPQRLGPSKAFESLRTAVDKKAPPSPAGPGDLKGDKLVEASRPDLTAIGCRCHDETKRTPSSPTGLSFPVRKISPILCGQKPPGRSG
jgi:hypothetical protein